MAVCTHDGGLALVVARDIGEEEAGLQAWGCRLEAWGCRLEAWGCRLQAWGCRLNACGWRLEAWGCRLNAWGEEAADLLGHAGVGHMVAQLGDRERERVHVGEARADLVGDRQARERREQLGQRAW